MSGMKETEGKQGVHRVADHVKEYCSCTSIHGVQYLVGRPVSERLWWITVFVISFLGNSYLIRQVWTKWNDSPVIVTFSEKAVPVWDIPFPAITICPRIKYRATDYPELREYMLAEGDDVEMDEETLKQGNDLTLLCKELVVAANGSLYAAENITDFFSEVGPPLREDCTVRWDRVTYEDDNIDIAMKMTVTADGPCMSFNLLGYHELFRNDSIVYGYEEGRRSEGWSLEGGYPADSSLDSFPARSSDYGITAGLTIWLYSDKQDFDYECAGLTPGFKVMIHNPAEVPNSKGKYFILESDQRAIVAIEPEVIWTTESLRSYSPESRQCYFSKERYLEHFKIYTQQNCEMECLANYTYEMCKCVGFYMPRKEDANIKLCGPGNKECMFAARKAMMDIERKYVKNGKGGCNCLPSCAEVKYKLDVTQTSYDWKKAEKEVSVDQINYASSKMVVYFPDKQFISQQRSELYGLVDFLANCGGLIGLFSGFSVLSIVEIFYFLTLRGYNNVYRRRRRSRRSLSRSAPI